MTLGSDPRRTILLGCDRLTVHDVRAVALGEADVSLGAEAAARMERAQAVLRDWLRADRPVYGLTRGLGNQAVATIPEAERARFSETC